MFKVLFKSGLGTGRSSTYPDQLVRLTSHLPTAAARTLSACVELSLRRGQARVSCRRMRWFACAVRGSCDGSVH